MRTLLFFCLTGFCCGAGSLCPKTGRPNPPLPEIPQLMHEVQEHQKQLEKVRENYT